MAGIIGHLVTVGVEDVGTVKLRVVGGIREYIFSEHGRVAYQSG